MRSLWLKLRALLFRRRVEEELDDEVRFHIEMETRANVRRGMPEQEARREALRTFGGMERFKEEAREARGVRPLEDLGRDVRHALRGLRRSPVFAGAVLTTLALGIGATTAVFSVVRGVLLDPLPFAEPDELVTVWLHNPAQGIDEDITSWPNFVDWREQGTTFGAMTAVRPIAPTITGDDGDPERLTGAAVSEGFFEMLGVPLALGRGFVAGEHTPDGARAVVLSHALWVRRFGGDPAVLGRTVELDDETWPVVGVAAAGARYPLDAELWQPIEAGAAFDQLREARGALWLPVIGRIAEGVPLSRAQVEMDAVAARLEEAYPQVNRDAGIALEPLRETLVGDATTPLAVLFGAVVFVLLVGCANVANLLMARGTARVREMAVRQSLGAGRGRLMRQVVTESAVLGLLGGGAGILLAVGLVGAIAAAVPADLPRLEGVGVDGLVLAFALAVSLGTGLLFGVLPALQVAGTDAGDHLREGARGSSGGVLGRLRPAFVAGQFAMALVLLVGAGLLVRSFLNLQGVDTGLDTAGVLSVELSLPSARYPDGDAGREFQRRVLEALEASPAVARAGVASSILLSRLPNMGAISLESRPGMTDEERLRNPVTSDFVTPGLFGVVGLELTEGRGFEPSDDPESPPVAVVNRTFVETFLPGGDPLGERFMFGTPSGDGDVWTTIVGVVEDGRRSGVDRPVRPSAYRSYGQFMTGRQELLVRARSGEAAALAPVVRSAVGAADPRLALSRVRTLDRAFAERIGQRRFVAGLLAAFAVAATLLAAIGIHGVMAYVVGRRTRELGIRVALGADRGTIVGGVLREAMTQAGIGIALGAAGALLLSRVVQSQLFGLEPTDPLTFLGVTALLAAVALLASWIPARRASRLPPSTALRVE